MVLKVISLTAMFAVIETQAQGYGHDHAFSSQSITMHQHDDEIPVLYGNNPSFNNYNDFDLQERFNQNQHRGNQFENQFKSQLSQYKHQSPIFSQDLQAMRVKQQKQHRPLSSIFPEESFGQNPYRQKKPTFSQNDFGFQQFLDQFRQVKNEQPIQKQQNQIPVFLQDNFRHHQYQPSHKNGRPEYEFDYKIDDKFTGDSKEHHESREGGVVKGSYSFQEADGTIRIVEYTADAINGFQAKVRHEGTRHKIPKHQYYNPYNHNRLI